MSGGPLVTPASANPTLDPTTQHFIDSLTEAGQLPLDSGDFARARAWLTALQSGPAARPPCDITDLTLPIGPTGSLDLRILRPPGLAGPLPAVLYFHGGAWVMGDRDTHDRLMRELAVGAQAAIVFVDYARAPEAQYPVQNEQAFAALDHVVRHATPFGLDPRRIAVAGDCCGGALAIVLALHARRRNGPAIVFQLLFYPVTGTISDHGSAKSFEAGPWLTAEAARAFCRAAFPDRGALAGDAACPLNIPLADLEALPPALVVTAENDMLRDDGEAYARRLMAAGIEVVATRYLGTIHDFVMLDALADTPPARAALAQATAALRQAFGT